jgi:putative serine protease PepD
VSDSDDPTGHPEHDAFRAPGESEPTMPFSLGARSEQPPAWTPPASAAYAAPGSRSTDTEHLPVAQHAGRSRGTRSSLLWPGVAALALALGLLGGIGGSVVYEQVGDGGTSGTVRDGLAGVDTVSLPPLDADDTSIAAVAAKLLPSTVQISAEFGGESNGATGSGFVLDKQGHVITNNHVVASAASDDGPIQVVDQDGNRYDATVVGRSTVYDLAVLYAPGATDLTPAALGSSRALRVGDSVVAIGSPLGLSSTVTAGIVSALNRPVTTGGDSADESSYINAVQTDAAINPGNSGGPLVNALGQVVGVNSAIATNGGASGEAGNIGVGFAIPVEQVRITADQILRTGEALYPVIGASISTGERNGLGAPVETVNPGTPAQRAGLQEGDLITAVDGERVTDGVGLIVSIRTHQPGETLEFSVTRGGAQRTISIELGSEVG